jgi:hypothetical protein
MSPAERDQWRDTRAGYSPRIGLFLQPVLDAAARIIEDEGREFEREHQRASS